MHVARFQITVSLFGLVGRVSGKPHVKRLALAHDVHQSLHRFFQRCLRVVTMGIEHVHVIQAHTYKALVETGHERLAASPVPVGTGPHVVTGLGRHKQFVAIRLEGFLHNESESLFGTAIRRTVIVRQIEMRDAMVESIMRHRQRMRQRIDVTEIMPQP